MVRDDHFEGVGDEEFSGDDESPGAQFLRSAPPLLNPQDFEDYWSEELVILYHALIDRARGHGWRLFESLDFCDFCKFAYTKSSLEKDPWA